MANPSIELVKDMLGDDAPSNSIVEMYLDNAYEAIMDRLYPFGVPENTEFPTRYERLACNLAVRYISRRGAEGQTDHSENGISRRFKTVNDDDLLCVVTPFAKVM